MKKLKYYEVLEGEIGGSSWIMEVNTSVREAEKAARHYRKNTTCDEVLVVKNVLKFENRADFSEAKKMLNSIKNECRPSERIVCEISELADDFDPMFDSECVLSFLVKR